MHCKTFVSAMPVIIMCLVTKNFVLNVKMLMNSVLTHFISFISMVSLLSLVIALMTEKKKKDPPSQL